MTVFCLQEAIEASYVATMKTIRQVKTVFVIFIAFVCCWTPYIVVLLYDSADSLPLPVHMYTSMLAHLHASLNFTIYGLSQRAHYRRQVARLVHACCCRRHQTTRTHPDNNDASINVLSHLTIDIRRRTGRDAYVTAVDVSRALVDAVECHQSPVTEIVAMMQQ